ncbi:MAG TPA: Swt1 family HEPN domain-containing protein [Candidatus Obscuribacterales bacterium]
MAINNRERVGRALDLLGQGLYPYIEREMRSVYRDKWIVAATPSVPEDRTLKRNVADILKEDISALLKLMGEQWHDVFKKTLGHVERSLVSELRETRNSWAHNGTFSTDDAYRALDSVTRLLAAISAPEADAVEKQKQELLRLRFEEQARRETRKAAVTAVETNPAGGLKSWREIVTPHPDVASGRYQQAEFAADLWQVYLDEGSDEYRIPTEFFRRTYLTEGLKQLLTNALTRLSGKSGDPVIELQTNFGGGKTHAMLALYHLFFGVSASDLPGLEPVFATAGVSEPAANVKTVVLVGNKISPGQLHQKKDGTVVRTLWGELAWQLGGKEGYEMVREADETATNPGDNLKQLFNRYAPCLILIDEWVAYARQLHEEKDLPAGSFDTHFTFAQTLSESAKNANRTLLVVSIPSSDIEIGGDRGKEALDRLKNAIGRVESPWRPASAEESFEIVRRRLFQPLTDRDLFVARDAVVRAFSEMYRQQSQEFPLECREADYERRLKEAYPIHPELFDRLYSDWSTLDKFQRTRGVLRLMAKVIHSLWEQGDRSLLILPANVPMADAQVQSELTRYLDDQWVPVIEKDVDGINSLPVLLDGQNPNLGRYSACRRVTRTIYLGSAPTLRASNRGIEDRRIKLGCVQPGESPATFGDALRRLTDQATYLYLDGNRYWISTQPNVTRTAQDRAAQIKQDPDRVWEEIVRRLRNDRQRGEFAGVHIAPNSSADIPDDENMGVRLVVLGPQHPHSSKAKDSPARHQAEEILATKGASPRYCKNLLLFLASDKTKIDHLVQSVCQYLAWDEIVRDKEILNLDVFQSNQATSKQKDTDKTVELLLQEAYQWLLIPTQPNPQGAIVWEEPRLQGQDSPILRASRKLVHEEHLITHYSATRLCLEVLVLYIWPNSDRIDLNTLWKYLTNYPYLPRLKNEQALLSAIQEGVAALLWTENFAYATGWDEAKQRYLGLKAGEHITATLSSQSWLVKPDVAQQQISADAAELARQHQHITLSGGTGSGGTLTISETEAEQESSEPTSPTLPKKKLQRFYGSADLDPLRVNRDAGNIATEILQHLSGLMGAEVQVTIEIQVNLPDGVPDHVIRTVTENCRTLKFKTHSFEEE